MLAMFGRGLRLCLLSGKGSTTISCHGPDKTTARSNTAIGTVDETQGNSNSEYGCSSSAVSRLQYHLGKGALCRRCKEQIKIDEAK